MSNSFITPQFSSRFNTTRGQLRPNQGPIRKEKKSTNCPTGFSLIVIVFIIKIVNFTG